MRTLHIATACFLNHAQELLVVRKQGSSIWMLPGGKIDAQESAKQAVVRELQEELQIQIAAADLQALGAFEAQAANEAETIVKAQVFLARLPNHQSLHVAAEIAEMQWLAIHQPLPANIAPLLRQHIIPALSVISDKR